MEEKKEENVDISKGLATGITSLVCAILSIVSLIFIIISIIFAVISIITGIMSTIQKNSIGRAGLTIGICSLALTGILFIVLNVLDVETLFTIPSWYM